MLSSVDIEAALHSVEMDSVSRRLVELACAQTDTRNGAVFLYDSKGKGLSVDFHMVEGVMITLPGLGNVLRARRDGRPNGIAFACFELGRPYVCNDTSSDPNYARYFLDVGSVLAVPIPWQGKPIGVLTVSSQRTQAFTPEHITVLADVAATSAKFLRRAQLARATRDAGKPFVIKGLSPAWHEVERRIEQISSTDAPVLITGESGTGKDLIARAIHFNSKRSHKPMVTVNCAAIPESMSESVFFGHLRGAFTGATFDKLGEFQKADGGTLFLDELGELPLMLQAKVLRAIEQGEVTPIGSNAPPGKVDVRLLCATNRDLPAMVRAGTFREDLFFRVGVMTVELPPLRSYKDNLEILSQVFLQQAAQRHGRKVSSMSRDAIALLMAYDFPGNMRELKNSLEHAVVMARSDQIRAEDLPKAIREGAVTRAPKPSLPERPTLAQMRELWVAPHEAKYLTDVLDSLGGNIDAASKIAGINRVTMYRLMKKHGITVKRSAQRARSQP